MDNTLANESSSQVKIFAWHICRDALPTLTNLENKKVNMENKYIFCHLHNEDLVHALFRCKDLWSMWKLYVLCFSTMIEMHDFLEFLI